MEDIQYIGEHLLPGKIGHLAILLGFVSALLASVAYYMAVRKRDTADYNGWRLIGRTSFSLHGLSVLTVIGVIFYVMVNKYYEYNYVFAHVNEDLPFQYIFSAFWEGQEGSFLLWMFWHVVLGGLLIFTAKKWEAGTMSVLALIEVFINSMILGLYFGFGDDPFRMGSNPLLLLRDTMDAPIFSNADYLNLIKGTGLNPLLQNYWMTIHPPTLFLGFASTSIPFAFAMAGFMHKDHKGWLKPVLPWALFSGMILGTGILMGGAWAYEALSFGGYWAWDPVENMSLVPWLILIAGIHTNLIARNTGHSIRSTYLFYILTFVLIVYSTFLTRSGVLGDTSVHAFTEMGLEWQLVGFIVAFALLGLIPFFVQYKQIPAPQKEEALASKEFWMFIGALILLFSAAMITASTSLPVYNKIRAIFDAGFEPVVITDQVAHHNKYQLWIGVFIGVLSGWTQYLRWKERNWSKWLKSFLIHSGVALLITAALTLWLGNWIDLVSWQYTVLLFAGVFTLTTNLDYLITMARGNLKLAASATSHIGFGLMIIGVLASSLNKHHISSNPFSQRGLLDEELLGKNVMLFEDLPMYFKGYRVTYTGDEFEGNNRLYNIRFEQIDEQGVAIDTFTVHPTALYDNKITKVAAYNPDTKHYLTKDIFTHLASIPLSEADIEYAREQEDSMKYRPYVLEEDGQVILYDTIQLRDSQSIRKYYVSFDSLIQQPTHENYTPEEGDLAIGARLGIEDPRRDTTLYVEPVLVLRGNLLYTYPVHLQSFSMKFRLAGDIFDQVFVPEDQLPYEPFTFKRGESTDWQGYQVTFLGFDREPQHPGYQKQEGDLAVSAVLEFVDQQTGEKTLVEPVYLIRGSQPFNLKDEGLGGRLNARFTGLDPKAETIEVYLAVHEKQALKIPFEVAEAPRTDFVVLEAIIFPGINFFWIGSIMMMLGMLLGMWNRLR